MPESGWVKRQKSRFKLAKVQFEFFANKDFMNPITHRKIIYGLALIGIVFMITMPDVLMGFLFETVHLFFELLFISFEWIESLLDKIVEHLFDTELHQTQVIVFYLMVGMVVFPLYFLGRMLLHLFFRLKETLVEEWALNKASVILYWQDSSLMDKIKWLVIMAGAIYLASFLVM
jgi:hypothetical protein